MCFSKEISIGTFIIGTIGSALVYSFNTKIDKILALFFFYIVLIQFVEFILWNNLTCNITNKITTLIAIIINVTQPILLALLLLYNYNLPNKTNIILLTILYSIMMLLYHLQNKTLCTLKNMSNHLEWKWNYLYMHYFVYNMYILYFLYIILSIPSKSNITLFYIILFSYLISLYIYWETPNIGTIWCFVGAFIPILWYFLKKIKYIK
jgi:hypothetical protein